jgi:enterochelin esterase family protein
LDGDRATFVWQGSEAPVLVGDFNDWQAGRGLQWRTAGEELWQAELFLPRDTYMEYGLLWGEERVVDPFNRRSVDSGVGETNHFFYMPEVRPTPLSRRLRGLPAGHVSRHFVPTGNLVTGRRRTVYLYQPPAEEPVPLVVVFDGPWYLRRARLAVILDNLIASQQIRPFAMAMIENGGIAGRMVEYACSESTLFFIVEQVLPLAANKLSLTPIAAQPGSYGVLGASMGGLMALFTAMRLPEVFGAVLSQSGAFRFGPYRSVVADLAEKRANPALRVWLDTGRYEWLLEPNREMATLLRENGYKLACREFNAGHNFTAWRDNIVHGLLWLFARTAA